MEIPSQNADDKSGMTGVDRLSAYFRRMPVALYRSSPTGELLAANPALASLLGFETVEEMREHLTDVASVYVDPAERAKWMERIFEQGIVFDFDVELRRQDGTTIWARDTARAIRNDQGELEYYDGALIDVTDRIKAQRAKDEFIATVSHELRNPIAVMLGLGEELANDYDNFTDHDRRDLARLIARQAEDASWLIEDLLVAYRDDLSTVSVAPQDFDVMKEVERVVEVVDKDIPIQLLEGEGLAHADPRRTRQILRNLVSNAMRYGGSELRVCLAAAGDRIEVRIEDSGEKLSDSEVKRIFKPYVRGTSPIHPKSVGLGLSVARRLARLMDGDLTYRYSDDWSAFVLSLPVARPHLT